MTFPINNKQSKGNKISDHYDNKFSYLVEFLRDYFAVKLYKYYSAKEITNVIYDQIKKGNPIINIKFSYFQSNNALLLLLHNIFKNEEKRSLSLALEIILIIIYLKGKLLLNTTIAFPLFNKLRF